MSFPSLSLLFTILKTMVYTGAQCIILGKSCATFEVTKGSLNAWFTALRYWIEEKAEAITQGLLTGVWWWIGWLQDRANSAYDKAVAAVNWVLLTGTQLAAWYTSWKDRLTSLARDWYSRLVTLARDWYYRLLVLARDWYWWIKAVCVDSGNALVNLVRNWYGQINALATTWYARLVILARDWYAWLQAFIGDPWGTIKAYIGPIWAWLTQLWATPLALIAAILGHPWRFLLSLFGLSPEALLAFVRDTLSFWYNMWSMYREILLALVSDPAGTVLAVIRELFLDWLEDLIAENW